MDLFVYTFILLMTLISWGIVLHYAAAASPRRKAWGVINNTIHWALCALTYAYFPVITAIGLAIWAIAVGAMLYVGFDLGASIRAQYGIDVTEEVVAFEDLPPAIAAELERVKREG